jgi:hypothetical protein
LSNCAILPALTLKEKLRFFSGAWTNQAEKLLAKMAVGLTDQPEPDNTGGGRRGFSQPQTTLPGVVFY